MRKMWIVILILALGCQQAAAVLNRNTGLEEDTLVTARRVWVVAETSTSAGTEPSPLGINQRTFQAVQASITAAANGDDEIEFYSIPSWANGLRFTAIGITNDGTYAVEIYAGTLETTAKKAIADGTDCNLTNIGLLSFIIGQQRSTTVTYEMAQSVTKTARDWSVAWGTAGTVDSDRTCEATIDMMGADVLCIVAATCTADAKLLIKGY